MSRKSIPPLPGADEPDRPLLLEVILPNRINRLSYLWRVALWHVILITTIAGDILPDKWDLINESGMEPQIATFIAIALWVLAFLSLTAYGILYIYRPRMLDCGLNPWLLGLLLVPYISILIAIPLLFQPTKTWQPGQR